MDFDPFVYWFWQRFISWWFVWWFLKKINPFLEKINFHDIKIDTWKAWKVLAISTHMIPLNAALWSHWRWWNSYHWGRQQLGILYIIVEKLGVLYYSEVSCWIFFDEGNWKGDNNCPSPNCIWMVCASHEYVFINNNNNNNKFMLTSSLYLDKSDLVYQNWTLVPKRLNLPFDISIFVRLIIYGYNLWHKLN